MLFDLRSAGRRRTVKAIYAGLAVLMGGGLIFFGVGANVGGGLLDAFQGGGGGGGNTYAKQVKRLERRVAAHPQDAAAWGQLAKARYQATSVGDNYDQATSSFTAKGKRELQGVARAWDRYLALTKNPDPNIANLMVQAFGPAGLGTLGRAVDAMEIVVQARPKQYALWAQLAALAYAAGQQRKGDLSAQKAVSLAPASQRKAVRAQLDSIKLQAQGAGAPGAPGTSTAPPVATTG